MFIDLAIHHRLSETRFIALVMTVTTIADQVGDKILMERMAVSERGTGSLDTSLRIIGVDMNYRDLKPFCNVAGMQAAARFSLCSREPQLIVGDDMHRTARFVSGDTGEVKGFGDDTLSCKR